MSGWFRRFCFPPPPLGLFRFSSVSVFLFPCLFGVLPVSGRCVVLVFALSFFFCISLFVSCLGNFHFIVTVVSFYRCFICPVVTGRVCEIIWINVKLLFSAGGYRGPGGVGDQRRSLPGHTYRTVVAHLDPVTPLQKIEILHLFRWYTHTRTQTLWHKDTFTQQTLLHTNAFTHRSFYTQTLLLTKAFTHKRFYTQKLLHRDTFIHKPFFTQELLHTEILTRRRFYTHKLLHTNAFTHRHFYTKHTEAFKQTLLHRRFCTDAFTHRSFDAQRTEALYTQKKNAIYPSFWRSTLILCEKVALDTLKSPFFFSFWQSWQSNLVLYERITRNKLES